MVDIDASLSAFADRLGLSRKYVERSAYTRGPDEAFLAREAQAVATERVFGVTTVALERAWLHPEATEDDSTIAAAYQRRLARRAPVVEPRVRARPPESDGEATPLKRARSEELGARSTTCRTKHCMSVPSRRSWRTLWWGALAGRERARPSGPKGRAGARET